MSYSYKHTAWTILALKCGVGKTCTNDKKSSHDKFKAAS